MKKKFDGNEYTQKRKKQKTSKAKDNESDVVKAEVLDVKTLREGMLLLGCVTEIRSNCVLMSLPGCLVGNIPFSNVSRKFVEELRRSAEQGDEDAAERSLESVVTVGAVYPCKVMQITYKNKLKKPFITLSMDPKDVNQDLRLPSLYLKMVVYAAVESVEDHGYVMELGVTGAQGFLPFSQYYDSTDFTVGQVIATSVAKLPSPKNGNVVWLSAVSFEETYPEVENEAKKLSSILPGTNATAYVTEVKHPFYYMKCMEFDACANTTCFGTSNPTVTAGMKVSGTVLYVHPLTRMIYLSLGPKPTPQTFEQFFRLKKFDKLKNVKFEFSWHTKLFFKVGKGSLGYVRRGELPANGEFSQESLLTNPIVPKARVIFLHYMDNLVQLSFKEDIINKVIKRPEEVKVGDVFEATVKKHINRGMFVQMCPGLSGFVRHMFMSDVLVTMPQKLHPLNSKLMCRVVSKNQMSGLELTCKESLVNVPEAELLKSYEEAQEGFCYKGVIVQKKETYVLVLFFNDVKGVVPIAEVPSSSLLYVGQTVTCEVLQSNPEKQRIKLSIGQRKSSAKKAKKPVKVPVTAANISSGKDAFEPMKKQKAIITNINAHQLNIVVEGTFKGRVHISELGSSNEQNCLPLREFSTGTALKVHVLGQCDRKTHNFLPISHRMTRNFLECSIEYPPPISLETTFRPGMQVTGYVKEINRTYANLWLSPNCTGTLEYLHFSESPKVLRKLSKQLKVGLSLNVTVFNVLQNSNREDGRRRIQLTKLGNGLLEAGTNVVGLVKSASLEEGLVIKLPHGYQGTVSLTDLQDSYAPVGALLSKYSKLQFILCHVIEVDHASRNSLLSLRKSRLYRHSLVVAPEVTVRDLADGKHFKGYVRKSSGNQLIVNFGRLLDGRVRAHSCSTLGCVSCECTQKVLGKYADGSVVEVVVDGVNVKKGNLYKLQLAELVDMDVAPRLSRLQVTEDIDWGEV